MGRRIDVESESLSDLIRVSITAKKQREKHARGGLRSMGSRGSFVREPNVRSRRVLVKALVVKNKGDNWQEKRRKHTEYLQRDGTSIEGEKAVAYGRNGGLVDVQEFLDKSANDPHEFRFIISAEDAGKMELSEFIPELFSKMENRLGTRLEWMAVNHYNTDHPHTHIVMRGVDENGRTLILDPDFISNGIRNLASEIVTRKLGERTELEIRNELNESIGKERATQLDRLLERLADPNRVIDVTMDAKLYGMEVPVEAIVARLQVLREFGLAEQIKQSDTKVGHEYWWVSPHMLQSLKEMGFKGDIIKTLHREKIEVSNEQCTVLTPEMLTGQSISGKVVARGIANELTDKEYVVVRDAQNQLYYVELHTGSESIKALVDDEVNLSLQAPRSFLKKSDQNIVDFAKANNGKYDPQEHLKWVKINIWFPESQAEKGPIEYMTKHETQPEKMCALGLMNDRGDGTWSLDADFDEKLAAFEEQNRAEQKPRLSVEVVDTELDSSLSVRRINGKAHKVIPIEDCRTPIHGVVTTRGTTRLGKEFLAFKGRDGADYCVELDRFSERITARKGDAICLELNPVQMFFKNSDQNIAHQAAINGQIYDAQKHLEWVKTNLPFLKTEEEQEEFVERHVTRMKFLERYQLAVPIDELKWQVDSDILEKMETLQLEHEKKFKPRLTVKILDSDIDESGKKKLIKGEPHRIFIGGAESVLQGVVTGRGTGKHQGKYLTVVDAEGVNHYVVLERFAERNEVGVGDFVKIDWQVPTRFLRKTDRNIAHFVAENNQIYEASAHRDWVRKTMPAFRNKTDEAIEQYVALHEKRVKFLVTQGLAVKIDDSKSHVSQEMLKEMESLQDEYLKSATARQTVSLIESDVSISGEEKLINGEPHKIFLGEKGSSLEGVLTGRGSRKNGGEYLTLEDKEGQKHYVVLERFAEKARQAEPGDRVKIDFQVPKRFLTKTDRNIGQFVAENNQIYEASAHLEWAKTSLRMFKNASIEDLQRYVERHEGRMELLESLGLAQKIGEKSWSISPDMLERMAQLRLQNEESGNAQMCVTSFLGDKIIDGMVCKGLQPEEFKGLAEQSFEGVVFKSWQDKGKSYVAFCENHKNYFYFELPRMRQEEKPAVGDIIQLTTRTQSFFKKSDSTICSVALAKNDEFSEYKPNVFSEDKLQKWFSKKQWFKNWTDSKKDEFIDAHMMRLIFLERYGLVQRQGQEWLLVPDFKTKMMELDRLYGEDEAKARFMVERIGENLKALAEIAKESQRKELSLPSEGALSKDASQKAAVKQVEVQTKMVNGKECLVFERSIHGEQGLRGKVVSRGVLDGNSNKPYIVVNAMDDKHYLIRISTSEAARVQLGDKILVGLGDKQKILKKSDFNIAEFSRSNGHIYDSKAHLEWAKENLRFPSGKAKEAREDFVEKHVARVKFHERHGWAAPMGEGKWKMDPEFLDSLKNKEKLIGDRLPRHLDIQVLSRGPKVKISSPAAKLETTPNTRIKL